MTVLEMKENLNAKCKETWEILKMYERTFGYDSTEYQKCLTKWVTYEDLYLEFFGEKSQY